MEHSNIDTAAAVCAPLDFTADRAEFAAAVAFLAARVVERRNTLPILSCIMLQADMAGTVTLTGTDLDLAATVTIAATVEAPGAICLSADVLADGLKKAKGDSLGMMRLQEADGRAKVTAGRVAFKLPSLPVDDFPMIGAPTGGTEGEGILPAAFSLPASQLVADMAALAPCISKEESRYYLNGVSLQRRDMAGRDCLVMVATDGHSLGAVSRDLPAGADVLPDVIFPRKAVGLVKHIAKLAGPVDLVDVTCAADGRKLALTMGNVALVAKLIDGTFPDWQRLFEQATPTGGGAAPMFPELLPGAPTGAIERIGKACPVGLAWETRGNLFVGSAADDAGLIYAAMCCDPSYAGVKGFSFALQGQTEAREYLLALATSRGLVMPEAMEAACEAINAGYLGWNDGDAWEVTGECRGRIKPYGEASCKTELVTRGGRVVGLTIEGQEARRAWCEIVTDWETLHESATYHAEETVALEGSYSILMPADGPGQLTATGMGQIIGPDGVAYPVADDGRKIHLSAAQVKALMDCPESWAVVEFTGADGKPRYVNRDRWEGVTRWDDGELFALFGTVQANGRCFKDSSLSETWTRAEIEAALAGESVAVIEASPTVEMEAPGAIEEIQPEAPASTPESAPEPFEAVTGRADAVEASHGPEIGQNEQSAPDADPIASILARLDAIEAAIAAPLPAESTATPTALTRPKRTPAHERAIRRAWVERKRTRELEAAMLNASNNQRDSNGEIMRLRTAADESLLRACDAERERDGLRSRLAAAQEARDIACRLTDEARAKRRRAVLKARDLQHRLYAEHKLVDQANDRRRKARDDWRNAEARHATVTRERDAAHVALQAVTARAERAEAALAGVGERLAAVEGVIQRRTA